MASSKFRHNYPPALNSAQSDYLLTALKDWSAAHGLAVRPPATLVPLEDDPEGVLAVTAPVTLFPSLFPRSCFDEACSVQKTYNELYAAISRDQEWLGEIMRELIVVDEFIAKLWEIHHKVKGEGYVQDLSLGLFRSDYMVHVEHGQSSTSSTSPQIKQVEFNTIASSFGGLASRVSRLHKHMYEVGAYPKGSGIHSESFPPNEATESLAAGLHGAHEAYGSSKHRPALPLCVIFIVQSPERNVFDQRHLEYALHNKSVTVFRVPFSQTLAQTRVPVGLSSRPLIYTPPHSPNTQYEVSVVYFRSCYAPDDYNFSSAWKSRHHLERSAAIKCPSILTHLAGSKKVQQVLATPGAPYLSRFIHDKQKREQVRKTFANMYPLDSTPAGHNARKMAMDPDYAKSYVLKPQREGGGNNVYRTNIPKFLQNLGMASSWRAYILMELIEPPKQQNIIIRNGEIQSGDVIAELGIYGVCLWKRSGEVLKNFEAGYLLRTKGSESEEGGVAAGFGAVDSVALVDWE